MTDTSRDWDLLLAWMGAVQEISEVAEGSANSAIEQ